MNLPASARDMGFIPGPGRFRMPWGNCPCTAVTEALEPVLYNKRSHCNEKHTAARESSCAATKTQCSHKYILKLKRSRVIGVENEHMATRG